MDAPSLSALDLTHVLYDSTSHVAKVAAFLTLSPILLMPCYVGIIVAKRELTVINMILGQLASDVFNSILKHTIRQERPNKHLGDGYGFPSSHSQYMGYFSTFLLLHLSYRHKFTSYGPHLELMNVLQRVLVYLFIWGWAAGVCFSRYHLGYHTPLQVLSGYSIGVVLAFAHYGLTESTSLASEWRGCILNSTPARFWRIRDGWDIYPDGGVEDEYAAWKTKWDAKQKQDQNYSAKSKSKSKQT